MNSNLDILLNRLRNVRRIGDDRWRACCPVHDSKSRSSLAIWQKDDGTILMHCFGSCDPLEILNVCGLEMADLFPERLTHNASPAQRQKWRQMALHRDWTQAAESLEFEARIVCVAARDLSRNESISEPDLERLDMAMVRIENVRKRLCER